MADMPKRANGAKRAGSADGAHQSGTSDATGASSAAGSARRGRTPAPHGSMAARTRGFTLFTVRGVPIRIDLSWLVIAGLVAWSFGSRMATEIVALADAGPVVIGTAALAATLLFFASLLAHEMGHAFTSLDRDIPVVGITLFLLGGVTESTKEAKTARDEFIIVGVGPFISLVLAAVFGLIYTTVTAFPAPAAVIGYLAWTNLALAVFNVLPGYPLDGGRLLRSILWMATGKPHTATRWAARVGQIFALLLVLGAAWGLLGWPLVGPGWVRFVIAVFASLGLWGGLIGFFLFRGASQAHGSARLRERLSGQRVRDVMGSAPPTLSPDATLAEVADGLARKPSLLWPIGEPVQGVIRLKDLDSITSDQWPTTRITRVASSAEGRVIDAEAGLDEAIRRLVAAAENQLVVTEQGRAVGLLTESLLAGFQR